MGWTISLQLDLRATLLPDLLSHLLNYMTFMTRPEGGGQENVFFKKIVIKKERKTEKEKKVLYGFTVDT